MYCRFSLDVFFLFSRFKCNSWTPPSSECGDQDWQPRPRKIFGKGWPFLLGGVQPEIAEIIRNSGVYTFGKLGCPLKNDGWKIPSFWNTRPFSGSTFNHLTGGWGGMRKSVYPLTWSNYSTRQKPPKGSV